MTEAIVKYEAPALQRWTDMDDSRRRLLREVCSGSNLTDSEFELLCEVAMRTGLDPMQRQIYGLRLGGKFQIITGIDGFRTIARDDGLCGIDEPVYEYLDPERRIPSVAKITVHRRGPNGERESYVGTAHMREFKRKSPTWDAMPHRMLAKCAEAHAHRMAFKRTSGLYLRDEFDDAPIPRSTGVKQVGSAAQLLASAEPDAEPDAELEPDEPTPFVDAP